MFTSTTGKFRKGVVTVLVAVGLTATGLLLAGCQTAKPTQPTAMSEAVRCPKCEVTWVKVPRYAGKSGIVGYSTFKKMECPDCRNAVLSFFETGKFQHTCKTCGDVLEHCKAH
jgi:ribosomal protein S27E